jgi:hypothetical protein
MPSRGGESPGIIQIFEVLMPSGRWRMRPKALLMPFDRGGEWSDWVFIKAHLEVKCLWSMDTAAPPGIIESPRN